MTCAAAGVAELRPSRHYSGLMLSFESIPAGKKVANALTSQAARGLVALVFAFYVNYLPVHLLAERHFDETFSQSQPTLAQHDDHDDSDHDHHKPHPAAAHSTHLLRPSDSAAACLAFLAPGESVVPAPIESPETRSFPERVRPSSESPPDPLQPRAPPAA